MVLGPGNYKRRSLGRSNRFFQTLQPAPLPINPIQGAKHGIFTLAQCESLHPADAALHSLDAEFGDFGKGVFTDVTAAVMPAGASGRLWDVEVADLGRDGTLDVFMGSWGTQAVLRPRAGSFGRGWPASGPDGGFEVREFHVVPCFRHKGWGTRFAHGIWSLHPGEWEVKQIEGADYAVRFWRKAIAAYGGSAFTEDRFQDSY